jgi:hypothetical protein
MSKESRAQNRRAFQENAESFGRWAAPRVERFARWAARKPDTAFYTALFVAAGIEMACTQSPAHAFDLVGTGVLARETCRALVRSCSLSEPDDDLKTRFDKLSKIFYALSLAAAGASTHCFLSGKVGNGIVCSLFTGLFGTLAQTDIARMPRDLGEASRALLKNAAKLPMLPVNMATAYRKMFNSASTCLPK